MDKETVQRLTPTALAFIGDAVETLYIRKRLLESSDAVCGTLHTEATRYVNASEQAAAFDELSARGAFTEAEADIARRAKNAHLHVRGNSSPADYHRATALEAVIGYLELNGNTARRDELLDFCFRRVRGE